MASQLEHRRIQQGDIELFAQEYGLPVEHLETLTINEDDDIREEDIRDITQLDPDIVYIVNVKNLERLALFVNLGLAWHGVKKLIDLRESMENRSPRFDIVVLHRKREWPVEYNYTLSAEAPKFLSPHGIWADDIVHIAEELGLKWEHIDNCSDERLTDSSKRDLDILYLQETGYMIKAMTPNAKPCDAMILFKGRRWPIRFEETSKAFIRKLLSDEQADEATKCAVCFDEFGDRDAVRCAQCNGIICTACFLKTFLDQDLLHRIRNEFGYRAPYKCVQCRSVANIDLREVYFRVMERLEEFPPIQREILLLVQERDPHFEERMEEWKRWERKYPLRQFRKGSVVRLHGLKGKKEWNGKKAVILSEGGRKDDTYRWPIQLMDGSQSKAMIKQSNMKKLKQLEL